MRVVVASVLAVCFAVAVAGCAPQSAFRSDGIPQDRYLVGGGWDIDFSAPGPGTVYLVEANYAKLIEMKSLEEGDSYRLTIDPGESRLRDMGIEPSAAKFRLYFIPVAETDPCPNEPKKKVAW